MVTQRVYGLALGYHDLNDHETLRIDPVFGMLAERSDLSNPLAGKSPLNRMELGSGIGDRYKKITFWKAGVDELMVNVFLEAHVAPLEQIILDMDTNDLREARSDAASGSLVEIRRIIEQIRAAWPKVKIILRGDSGFCRQDLMECAEADKFAYLFGLARNKRLGHVRRHYPLFGLPTM